jgi:hypothetical protein
MALSDQSTGTLVSIRRTSVDALNPLLSGPIGFVGGGDVVEQSLSDLFADDEEKFDIFGERSMAGSIAALNVGDTTSDTKRNYTSKSSVGCCSTGTWQGNCESFIGDIDDILNLSCSDTDLFASGSALALYNKPKKRKTKMKKIPTKEYSQEPTVHLSSSKSRSDNAIPTSSSQFDSKFPSKSPDTAPRKPIRGEQIKTSTLQHSKALNNSYASMAPSNFEEDPHEEVIVFNLMPKKRHQDIVLMDTICPLVSGHDSKFLLSRSMSVPAFKEDEAPKRPQRGLSPERPRTDRNVSVGMSRRNSKIGTSKHLTQVSNTVETENISILDVPTKSRRNGLKNYKDHHQSCPKLDAKANFPVSGDQPRERMARSPHSVINRDDTISGRQTRSSKRLSNDNKPTVSSTRTGAVTVGDTPPIQTISDIIISPRRRIVKKIALKDMEKQFSGGGGTPPRSDKNSPRNPMSAARYKKLMEAASSCPSLKNDDGKTVKISFVSGNKDGMHSISSPVKRCDTNRLVL